MTDSTSSPKIKAMRRLMVALSVAAVTVAGCGLGATDEVSGKLVSKEYEPKNCEKKDRRGKCLRWDPSEYELRIQQADGTEVELVVGKFIYDNAVLDSQGTWTGRLD